ncbi:LOW QUALITY PROTEIN: hypothetical protein HID58_047127 [Brassica napus]|uniref:Uncharacterized protein n=1 Tax=Brassica napus TaxID=3708 RepID=A0ABQ8AYG6_BRANA|nr:LOW QUALITY PROTEIN: hypothetical protein HID58_047127 [Brassica napus]
MDRVEMGTPAFLAVNADRVVAPRFKLGDGFIILKIKFSKEINPQETIEKAKETVNRELPINLWKKKILMLDSSGLDCSITEASVYLPDGVTKVHRLGAKRQVSYSGMDNLRNPVDEIVEYLLLGLMIYMTIHISLIWSVWIQFLIGGICSPKRCKEVIPLDAWVLLIKSFTLQSFLTPTRQDINGQNTPTHIQNVQLKLEIVRLGLTVVSD